MLSPSIHSPLALFRGGPCCARGSRGTGPPSTSAARSLLKGPSLSLVPPAPNAVMDVAPSSCFCHSAALPFLPKSRAGPGPKPYDQQRSTPRAAFCPWEFHGAPAQWPRHRFRPESGLLGLMGPRRGTLGSCSWVMASNSDARALNLEPHSIPLLKIHHSFMALLHSPVSGYTRSISCCSSLSPARRVSLEGRGAGLSIQQNPRQVGTWPVGWGLRPMLGAFHLPRACFYRHFFSLWWPRRALSSPLCTAAASPSQPESKLGEEVVYGESGHRKAVSVGREDRQEEAAEEEGQKEGEEKLEEGEDALEGGDGGRHGARAGGGGERGAGVVGVASTLVHSAPPPGTSAIGEAGGRAVDYLGLTDAELLRQCQVDTYRASGPGGQHRNKTESAIRLRHTPTGCVAQSAEERSQHLNKDTALFRLRQSIALKVRRSRDLAQYQASVKVLRILPPSAAKGRLPRGLQHVGPKHPDFFPGIQELLDILAACRGSISEAATVLGVSTGGLSKLLTSEKALLAQVNEMRASQGLKPLR